VRAKPGSTALEYSKVARPQLSLGAAASSTRPLRRRRVRRRFLWRAAAPREVSIDLVVFLAPYEVTRSLRAFTPTP
jgi:hypothetical protein